MAKEIAIIQVCFNLLDVHQRKMFEHAESFPNKSGFLKRLIQRDMEGGASVTAIVQNPVTVAQDDDFNASAFI